MPIGHVFRVCPACLNKSDLCGKIHSNLELAIFGTTMSNLMGVLHVAIIDQLKVLFLDFFRGKSERLVSSLQATNHST